ncbi:MAG: hypothetical protein ACK5U7_07005 [Bacteroidota bacterium]|jgi:hypothetical protein
MSDAGYDCCAMTLEAGNLAINAQYETESAENRHPVGGEDKTIQQFLSNNSDILGLQRRREKEIIYFTNTTGSGQQKSKKHTNRYVAYL